MIALVPVIIFGLYVIYDEIQHRLQIRNLRSQAQFEQRIKIQAMLEEEP